MGEEVENSRLLLLYFLKYPSVVFRKSLSPSLVVHKRRLARGLNKYVGFSLRKKCPNTEFFLVRIFSHSGWIRIRIEYLRIQSECGKIRTRKNSVFGHFSRVAVEKNSYFSVFGLNAEKYGPEKTPYLDAFYAVSPNIN